MARFLVKASEFKNVCKAVNDRKLAELKKEIIEILKNQDEKEVKKAIDYFNSQELHYTHLEKSFTGKWVEKAGYGIGTVRIWKGKKYKKIAPGKWARVFDKEGRGTNIAIGKLIAKVQKIDNVEDLMAFVMANKQRFVDENGVDLPVLDKLRAAVDARNGNVGSKTSGLKLSDKELERLKEQNMTVENLRHKGYTDEEIKEFAKPKASKEEIRNQVINGYKNKSQDEIEKDLAYLRKQIKSDDSMTVSLVGSEKMPIKDAIEILKDIKKNNNTKAALKEVEDAIDNAGDYDDIEELEKERKQLLKKLGKKPAEKESDSDRLKRKAEDNYGDWSKKDLESELKSLKEKEKEGYNVSDDREQINYILENKDFESEAEKHQNRSDAMKGNQNARKFGADWEEKRKEIQSKLSANLDKMLEGHDKAKDVYEKLQSNLDKRKADAELYRKYLGNQEEPETVKDFRKWCDDVIEQYRKEVTNTPSKEIISKWEETARNTPTEKLEEVYNGKQKVDYSNEYENFIDSTIINTFAKDKDLIFPQPYTMLKDIATRKFDNSDKIRLEVIKKELDARKNGTKAEFEKTKNRSDAMKGNQNARKYGLTDEQIEYYDIQEVVEEINGYPIVKNSEGKYSFVAEGRVKDRPEDFETNIDKVKERINDHYETEKNIKAAKNYDFKNAKLGSDVQYTKKNNGNHLYFKKSPDGSKVLSVTVNVSDMREPLNMVYEVSDTKTGESWQYETAYGNKEGLEWAVERPEQMEKEIKKFFKRDPNKEWNKQNTFDKEPSGIGTFEKIDEKTVEMPTDKATRVLFDNLNKSRSTDKAREFMTDCYYDGENLVATDGKRLTIIKTGNVGFEPGYVNVKTDGGKVTLERIEKKELRSLFPNYKKVIPENNNQEVKLNNKILTEKLKEMRKNGSISKDIPKVALNFENGKVMLDGVQVGTADNVSFDDERQRIIVNANYLKDALNSGETSNMFVSDNPNKAMVLKTDVSDTIVMPFTNDVDVEYENKTSKKESASFERVDFKSMSDDELKDYEEKLSKELDDLNANSPEFVEKYNYWREVHGENNDRFHQRIEDEARAEKQAETDAKAQKENEIKERYNGYFENRKGLDKARDLKTLEKKYNFDGKVMSSKEFVEQAMDNGVEIKEREVNKLDYPSRTRWNRMNGYEQDEYEKRIKAAGKKTIYSIDGYEFPKTVVDYAKFYKEKKGNVKKSAFDDFVMDMFIDEDEEIEDAIKTDESLFNDYSAEQPELFNSTSMMVREAFNRCRVL